MSDKNLGMGKLLLSLPVSKDSGRDTPNVIRRRFTPDGFVLWVIVSLILHLLIWNVHNYYARIIGWGLFLFLTIYVSILYLTKPRLEIYENGVFFKIRWRLRIVATYVPFKDIEKVLIERFFGGATFSLEILKREGISVYLPAGKVAIFDEGRSFVDLLSRTIPGKVDILDANRPMF